MEHNSRWNHNQLYSTHNYNRHSFTEKHTNSKNDIAIATETKPIPEPIPRLIHMVACRTEKEYKKNQEKIRKFFLEDARALKATSKPLATICPQDTLKDNSDANYMHGQSSIPTRSNANASKKDSEQKDSNKPRRKQPQRRMPTQEHVGQETN